MAETATSLSLVLVYFFMGFLMVFLCIYLLHKIWNEKFPPSIPIFPYSFTENSDQPNFHTISSFSDLFYTFYKLLLFFEDEYWLKNCGFDAFSYIVYQRKMISFLVFWLVLLGFFLSKVKKLAKIQ